MDGMLGEIRFVAIGFLPIGWSLCDGSIITIASNQPLYTLLGNVFGGNPQQGTFALPDLRGRAAAFTDSAAHPIGSTAGSAGVVLNSNQMGSHTHVLQRRGTAKLATNKVNTPTPMVSYLGAITKVTGTTTEAMLSGDAPMLGPLTPLTPASIIANTNAVAPDPHENRQPYLSLQAIICVQGEYPNFN